MTTEEKIKAMEAVVNGKQIQRFEDGKWEDCDVRPLSIISNL